jgi:2,4-dienoyl-CoA reductase-like NADH-dependent reductase (Old Yellow Enzyme family)
MGNVSVARRSLFEPCEVAGLRLRNRFAMAPMTRSFSPEGIPGPDVAEYYARRARGGVGLIITEGTYIPHPATGPDPRVPHLYGEEALEGWRRVVDDVHAAGGAIVAQLWHVGASRGNAPRYRPDTQSVSPSGIATNGTTVGRALETRADLDEVIDAYAQAAANALAVGFDGIELHGAHGYLLDEFLWHGSNLRTDAYGEGFAGRARFPAEVIAAVRTAVGPTLPIIYRFSQWKDHDYQARLAENPNELEQLLAPLVAAGVDVFHVSTRRYFLGAFPDLGGADGLVGLAGWTKRVTGLPTITVGQVGLDNDFQVAFADRGGSGVASIAPLEEMFERDEFDLVAVGRALLADPEWVNKMAANRSDEIVPFTVEYRRNLR